MKKCPYCAEEIQDTAIKCRYCREWLEKSVSGGMVPTPAEQSAPQEDMVNPPGIKTSGEENFAQIQNKIKEKGIKSITDDELVHLYRLVKTKSAVGSDSDTDTKLSVIINYLSEEIKKRKLPPLHSSPVSPDKDRNIIDSEKQQANLENYTRIEGQKGEVFCHICEGVSQINGMLHHSPTDTYYHKDCLIKSLNGGNNIAPTEEAVSSSPSETRENKNKGNGLHYVTIAIYWLMGITVVRSFFAFGKSDPGGALAMVFLEAIVLALIVCPIAYIWGSRKGS